MDRLVQLAGGSSGIVRAAALVFAVASAGYAWNAYVENPRIAAEAKEDGRQVERLQWETAQAQVKASLAAARLEAQAEIEKASAAFEAERRRYEASTDALEQTIAAADAAREKETTDARTRGTCPGNKPVFSRRVLDALDAVGR